MPTNVADKTTQRCGITARPRLRVKDARPPVITAAIDHKAEAAALTVGQFVVRRRQQRIIAALLLRRDINPTARLREMADQDPIIAAF